MTSRASRPDVRNPVLSVIDPDDWQGQDPAAVAALVRLMERYEAVARENAETAWKRHKAPMASYWKIWAVNLRHARIAIRATMKEGVTHAS